MKSSGKNTHRKSFIGNGMNCLLRYFMDNMPLDLDISELLPMDIHEWDNLRNTHCLIVFLTKNLKKKLKNQKRVDGQKTMM